MKVELPIEKKEKLKLIINFKSKQSIKIRQFAKILGFIVSCCAAVNYGWLYTKISEREKFLALLANNDDYNKNMLLSEEVINELNWWKQINKRAALPIRNTSYCLEIFSDASKSGWGAYSNGKLHPKEHEQLNCENEKVAQELKKGRKRKVKETIKKVNETQNASEVQEQLDFRNEEVDPVPPKKKKRKL
ncbi:hypothetical protein TKK_0007802 [Trichogramma kaykai]